MKVKERSIASDILTVFQIKTDQGLAKKEGFTHVAYSVDGKSPYLTLGVDEELGKGTINGS